MSRSLHRRGFTFLEVMVSLAILAMALTVLSGISANSFDASNYAKFLTVTTMLARSKMIDIEEELRKDGFGDDEKTFDGDFSEEGHPGIKWKAVCRPIEVDISSLIYSLLGGDVDPESLPDAVGDFLGSTGGSLPAAGTDVAAAAGEAAGGADLNQLLAGGGLEPILKGVGETLQKSIREIELEITWKPGDKFEESVRFVQYVTTSGRLALPETAPVRLADPNLPGQRNAQTLQGTIGGQPLPRGTGGGVPGGTINIGSPGGKPTPGKPGGKKP